MCYTKVDRGVVPVLENKNRLLLQKVFNALQEKRYHPIGQIVGYILTEDPTYITNHNGARQLIRRIDRDDLLRDIVAAYFNREEAVHNRMDS
nr:IreB family regulatory phosphoprotein [uncultured Oscillibacter sp.]